MKPVAPILKENIFRNNSYRIYGTTFLPTMTIQGRINTNNKLKTYKYEARGTAMSGFCNGKFYKFMFH